MNSANRVRPPGTTAYLVMLTYYWLLEFLVSSGMEVDRGGAVYLLYVVPVAIFSAVILATILGARRLTTPARLILLYAGIVGSVAMVRGDVQTVATSVLFSATVATVFICALRPPVAFLNALFAGSILLESALFLLGKSIYATVPGFSQDGELWWRVSIFPEVAPSAYFCLIVLFANLVSEGERHRRLWIALAGYFLVFSGLRSALIAAFLGAGYHLLVKRRLIRRPRAQIGYIVGAISAFVLSLLSSQILLLLPSLGNEALNMYLFRSGTGLENEVDAARTIYRTWIWSEHLRIAAANPIFGVGTFNFTALANYDPLLGNQSQGSEAFLTGLYARVGLPSLLLLASFFAAIVRGIRLAQPLVAIVGISLFVAMLAYGSFLNAYDFVFLVMIGLMVAPDPADTEVPA